MSLSSTKRIWMFIAGVATTTLVLWATLGYSPSMLTWLAQPEGVNTGGGVGLSSSGVVVELNQDVPELSQEILDADYPIDAVAVHLPTARNALDGELHMSIVRADPGAAGAEEIGNSSKDLSLVEDWAMEVFRFDEASPASQEASYTISISIEKKAMVVAANGNPYPGALELGGNDALMDLTMRVYRRVPWPEFLQAIESTSDTKAPAWLTGVSLMLVPVLLGLSVSVLFGLPDTTSSEDHESDTTASTEGTVDSTPHE